MKKLLNLGCGGRFHPAWTNLDFVSTGPGVIAHDLKHRLPFSDSVFDAVYHSHVLEHFSKDQALSFLKECNRVLKEGGIIRVVVPDLEQIVTEYLDALHDSLRGDKEARDKYDWIMLELFDQMVRNASGGKMIEYWNQTPMPAEAYVVKRLGSEVREYLASRRLHITNASGGNRSAAGMIKKLKRATAGLFGKASSALQIGGFRLSGEIHQWMYDRYSLGEMLDRGRFSEIKVCRADESAIPDFNDYFLDIEVDGRVRKPDSLFMEGMKK
jgi:predicted SAM-dependent methyltransferase